MLWLYRFKWWYWCSYPSGGCISAFGILDGNGYGSGFLVSSAIALPLFALSPSPLVLRHRSDLCGGIDVYCGCESDICKAVARSRQGSAQCGSDNGTVSECSEFANLRSNLLSVTASSPATFLFLCGVGERLRAAFVLSFSTRKRFRFTLIP